MPFSAWFHWLYPEADTPADVGTYYVELYDGDALIMGTDWLWDNMIRTDVAKLYHELLKTGSSALNR